MVLGGENKDSYKIQRILDEVLFISLSSSEGILVGLGEISPLKGVHSDLAEAKEQIKEIQNAF